MADIAKLLLEGARPVDEAGGRPKPQRISPKDRDAAQTAPQQPVQPAPIEYPPHTAPAASCLLAITGETDDRAWQLARAAATSLAQEQEVTVAVVGLLHGAMAIECTEQLPPSPFTAGPADVQLARTLFSLKNRIDHWLIIRPATGGDAAALARAVPDWLLLSGTTNDLIVNAYKALKSATTSVAEELKPQVNLFLHASDFAEAAAVHNRFRHACQGFLNCDLQLAGVGSEEKGTHLISTFAAPNVAPLVDALLDFIADSAAVESSQPDEEPAVNLAELPHAGVEAALYQVERSAEEVSNQGSDAAAIIAATIDQLANVLDPEERAALSDVGFANDEPEPTAAEPAKPQDFDIRRQVQPAPSAAALKPIDLPAPSPDLAAQWQAVGRAIVDLLGGGQLLPQSPGNHAATAIDASGNLHLWLLAGDAIAFLSAQHWAKNFAAMRSTPATFTTHLVCPLGTSRQTPLALLGSDSLRLYQLHEITFHGHHGLIVVPA